MECFESVCRINNRKSRKWKVNEREYFESKRKKIERERESEIEQNRERQKESE